MNSSRLHYSRHLPSWFQCFNWKWRECFESNFFFFGFSVQENRSKMTWLLFQFNVLIRRSFTVFAIEPYSSLKFWKKSLLEKNSTGIFEDSVQTQTNNENELSTRMWVLAAIELYCLGCSQQTQTTSNHCQCLCLYRIIADLMSFFFASAID